jgi:hypothetical protein
MCGRREQAHRFVLFCAASPDMPSTSTATHNGGSVRVLPGRACHSALRRRAGISRGRGYRPCTGWTGLGEPIGGWPGSRCRHSWRRAVMRRNLCGGHGRPPGAEGTVLICPCAAGRRGLPDGGSTRFRTR